tara:strand:+ start:691 stop:1152 length:462 start_codon:yes stop_codon:yes gene_type:complete
MKKLLLILLCVPLITLSQGKILAKYNGTEVKMGPFYEMSLLLCGNCHSEDLRNYKWKNISNWQKEDSKILKLSYYANINFDEDEIEYYTISEEVKNLKKGDIYWIELEFIDLNNIFLNGELLDHSAKFISAKKATENEITEYFFLKKEDYSDW